MIYLKSLALGVAGGLIAALAWIVLTFVLPIFLPLVIARLGFGAETGSSVVGATISSGSILLAALVGFIAAFCWGYLRS